MSAFLPGYSGQTTEELLALASEFRIDSLVLAFEEALQQQGERRPLAREERYVLAVEALEREVNNGGYGQFFLNASNAFVDVIEEALAAIGCPKTAAITRDAIAALGLPGPPTPEAAEAAVLRDDERITARLADCDSRYFDGVEPIADRLFEWIGLNRAAIGVGAG